MCVCVFVSPFSQASEEVSKCLVAMKEILYGTNDKEPHTETVAQLAQELYNSGLLISMVENLQVIDFEVKHTDTYTHMHAQDFPGHHTEMEHSGDVLS